MPLGGLLAYLNELQPASLDAGAENELPYQGAGGDMDLESELPPPGAELLDPDGEEQMLAEAPPELGEDIAMEGEEGFPGMDLAEGSEMGMDPRLMAMAQSLLGGVRG